LAPQPRKRNAQKSDYIKTLLESAPTWVVVSSSRQFPANLSFIE
jgi:hypothetical protein